MATIKFTNTEEQKDALRIFLDGCGKYTREYRTTHADSVDDWIFYFAIESAPSLTDLMGRNDSNELGELLSEFKDILPGKVIVRTLADHATMETCGIGCVDNALFQQTVGEIEDQVSGISGTVNDKQVNCLLTALTDGLTLDDKKEVARALNEAYWNPAGGCSNCIYVNCDYDGWAAVVDVDAARDALQALVEVKKL